MSRVPALPPASEPVSPASAAGEDVLGLRIGAALIDLALLFGLLVLLSVLIGEASVEGGSFSFSLNSTADAALYFGLVLVYYFALEATIGQTVGKLLVGVRVVRADGGRPSVSAVAIRTLVRVVDWLPVLYLVGFIVMLATGARRRRLGDLAARTGIARAVPIRHRGLTAAAVASSLVLVVAGSVVYVAASASTSGQADGEATATTNQTTTQPAANASEGTGELPAPSTPEPAAPPSVLKVGQAFTWEDGTTAIVTGVSDGTINKSFDPEPAKIVTIQVQNGTGAVLDLTLAEVVVTFGPAGVPGEQGFDIDSGADAALGFPGSLPPGGTMTAEYAYVNVADASVINIEFAPTWEHESAFWTAP